MKMFRFISLYPRLTPQSFQLQLFVNMNLAIATEMSQSSGFMTHKHRSKDWKQSTFTAIQPSQTCTGKLVRGGAQMTSGLPSTVTQCHHHHTYSMLHLLSGHDWPSLLTLCLFLAQGQLQAHTSSLSLFYF